ncbi:NAD(P)-binding protein [Plenodomus tracheiphilus IPT5]|uniref:D-xylose 1-dehydrogenase (NADP(+), D-xylono-1,5-lactone-forming) n=1 Tax=Plenodomus tracheiphilus IPT5 TaxID=1408161 RepID=A0A6A7BEC9_9PLEO|nr:NAD(P)-binding protein [Plenodomus tracheiphilus IPT5]
MPSSNLPTLRWGIVTTGAIAELFILDLLMHRPSAPAHHTVTAIGSSTLDKGEAFIQKHFSHTSHKPTLHPGYTDLYTNPNIDIVYIGLPNSMHKESCLAAINAGKHVLCEKAFTLRASDAEEIFALAEKRGVFVMEAMWTRFFPLVYKLQSLVHEEKLIGKVERVFADFSQDHKLNEKRPDSRLRNPALGAGSLLNLGVYSVTWGLLALDAEAGGDGREGQQELDIKAVQVLREGIDVASTIILTYPQTGQTAICTSSSLFKNPDRVFCRIEGTKGHITVEGQFASKPESFTLYTKDATIPATGKRYEFEISGSGLIWEADAVAADIAAKRTQNEEMPWKETVRVMRILDEVRKQGGARFPGD